MSDVVSLGDARAKKSGDNSDWSPLECLEDAAMSIKSGEITPTAVLIITLEKSEDTFSVGWAASNVKGSEMISMVECLKGMVLRDMGFT